MPSRLRLLCCADGTCADGTQVPVRLPVPSLQHLGKVNGVLGGVSIELAYYGDDLDDLVRSCDTSDSSVIRRRDGRDDELDPFVADLVDDLRIRAEIADGDVRAELGAGAAEKGPDRKSVV